MARIYRSAVFRRGHVLAVRVRSRRKAAADGAFVSRRERVLDQEFINGGLRFHGNYAAEVFPQSTLLES